MKPFNSSRHKIPAETIRVNLSTSVFKRIFTTSLYRNSLYLMVDTALTSVFGFIFWVIAARFYSEAEVGAGSAMISSVNFLAIISTVGLNLSVIRFLPRNNRPTHLINASLTTVGIIALLAGIIFVAGLDFWSPALLFIHQDVTLLIFFLLIVVLTTILDLIDSIFVAGRLSHLVFATSAIIVILKTGLLIILAFVIHSYGILMSWGLALFITLAISFLLLLPRAYEDYKLIPVIDTKLLGNIGKYASGSYVASLFSHAPSMILPLLVINLVGPENNAYFYIAWTISIFMLAIPQATSRSLFAEGANTDKNLVRDVGRCLKFTYMISVPVLVIFLVAGKWILLAFGPGYAANALTLLWMLCIANLLRGVYSIYIGILRITDRIVELVLFQSIAAITTVSLSYLAISKYGINGVGYAWLLVQVILAIIIGIRLFFWFYRSRNRARFST